MLADRQSEVEETYRAAEEAKTSARWQCRRNMKHISKTPKRKPANWFGRQPKSTAPGRRNYRRSASEVCRHPEKSRRTNRKRKEKSGQRNQKRYLGYGVFGCRSGCGKGTGHEGTPAVDRVFYWRYRRSSDVRPAIMNIRGLCPLLNRYRFCFYDVGQGGLPVAHKNRERNHQAWLEL